MCHISRNGDALILKYDLFSLPTAQHKAGLAGLLLHLDSLQQRRLSPIPQATVTAAGAEIELTRESLQTLFDDLYDAEWIETARPPKRKAKSSSEPEEEGETNKPRLTPKGRFLLYPDDNEAWHKLWQDFILAILRPRDKQREDYKARAQGKTSKEAEKIWRNLLNCSEGKDVTENISGSIFLGAEQYNAENVPFKDTVANYLLLHFWPLVSLIYVPRELRMDKSRKWRLNPNPAGFVLAIPEPASLEIFLDDITSLLKNLPTELIWNRPRAALIDLVEEGGLEYLYHFARRRVSRQEISFSISSLGLYHLERQGHRVRHLAAERLVPDVKLLDDYEQYRDKILKNPLFKTLTLPNLLRQQPWHWEADGLISRWPWPLFIYSQNQTPQEIPFFGIDVKKKFEAIAYNLQLNEEGGPMSDREQDDQLALRVYRLIQTYVNRRTEEKSGKKFQDFKQNKDAQNRIIYPDEYREARGKVCSDAFLSLRSRRDQDFIDYFTGTICSVPQFLLEADFLMVSQALTADWPRVKTLAMLALSAHSYL